MPRLVLFFIALAGCSAVRAQAIVALWDPAYVSMRPGASARLLVIANVRPGHVLIANQARSAKLRPLQLRLRPPPRISLGPPRYPQAEDTSIDGSDQLVPTYSGTVQIAVPVTVAANTAPGELWLTGELRYQSCSRRGCAPARSLPVRIPIDVQATEE
jgi:hypothetical protein